MEKHKGDEKRGEGGNKGKRKVCDTSHFSTPNLDLLTAQSHGLFSVLSVPCSSVASALPERLAPCELLTLHFSAGVFPSSLAALSCLPSYKPNRSTALGCLYSDHFYHNLYILNYKNDLCSFC